MRNKNQLWIVLFVIFGVIEIYGAQTKTLDLIYIFKPLLLPILGVYFYQSIKHHFTKLHWFFLIGIFFSFLGDTFLMLEENELYFILGLGSFLLTHIFYSIGFFKTTKKHFLSRSKWIVIPFLIYLVLFLTLLWPNLAALKIPVILYANVIVLMTLLAINLKFTFQKQNYKRLVLGAFLFMISDSILAISLFMKDEITVPFSSIFIMSTYLLAQYFILESIIDETTLHKKNPPKNT